MQVHNFEQGSPEWLAHRAAHFNASDAPAMMGVSKYKSREQLLREMHTGITPDVDNATQRRFDDGHRFEALARPIAEGIIGEELYPVTGTNGDLSASFDGLTMAEDINWEHKTLNDELRAVKVASDLHIQYRIQMEQQHMVSGAEKTLFMASKFDENDVLVDKVIVWYEPDLELRAQIAAGWVQFERDLANYVYVETEQPVIAAAVLDLPAVAIRVNGSISLISNLDKFGARLTDYVQNINTEPNDDQGFADAEAAIKTLQNAQDALESAEANALAQTADIDDMRKQVKMYADIARNTRLMLEKMVKARKESIKVEIVQNAKNDLAKYIDDLNKSIGKPYMPAIHADFVTAIKNKKTVSALRESANNELLRAKREASAIAQSITTNMNTLRELASDYAFLFSDTAQLVSKANDDLIALIKMRISEHQQAEAAKKEAERAAMQKAEEAKAAAIIAAEVEALRLAEVKRLAQVAADAEAERLAEATRLAKIEATEKALQATINQPVIVEARVIPQAEIKAAVIEHQDEIALFLNSLDVDDKKRQAIRPYLVEFVKFQASRNLQRAA